MKKLIYLLVILSFSLGNSQIQPYNNEFYVGGRVYDVTVPWNYDPNKTYPIVFELHSFDQNRHEMYNQEVVNEQQYISVRPEGKEYKRFWLKYRFWNTWAQTRFVTSTDDVAYIRNVYYDLKNKLGSTFDPEKVFVYGFSNGGAMAMKLVMETDLFKGLAVRSMSLVSGENIPYSTQKIPMLFVHATGDNIVPYYGGRGYYGFLSPDFEDIKTTVSKWANHNNLTEPMEIKYLKGSSNSSDKDFYFREYPHSTYPIYFYAISGGHHITNNQFDNANIKTAAIKMFKNPSCFGLKRENSQCN